jgi:hypothetical protein
MRTMLKWLFGGRGSREQKSSDALYMPKVKAVPDVEDVFYRAREAAAGRERPPVEQPCRHIVLVTPSRELMFCPCPIEGTMADEQVTALEQMVPSGEKRNIAVIALNEFGGKLDAEKLNSVIPFYGILLGLGYIGHAVWIFEGHPSALAAGCRRADALMVDSGMIPFLQEDWLDVASGVMRNVAIYVHDRATYSSRRVR